MQIYKDLFSKRFRAARERSGLKQGEIAEKLDVKPSTVSRWETGSDLPDDSRLPAICKILGVKESYFGQPTASKPPEMPDWLESARVLQHYLDAEPDTRLLALYILTDDDKYLAQYEAISDFPGRAASLKKILATS